MAHLIRLSWLLLGMTLASTTRADCLTLYQQAKTADLPTLEALYRHAEAATDCDDIFRTKLGERVGKAHLRQLHAQLQQNPKMDAIPKLNHILSFGRLWQALAMRGDAYHDQRDDYRATLDYQEALEIIADPDITPKPPAPQIIGKIFKKAERSRLLADRYPPAPVNRSTGKPGGLAALGTRGFIHEKVAIPITFNYDSTTFDAKGQAAANDLLDYLTQQGQHDITLIGHTDSRGADAYNLALSRRRAEAVKQLLVARGYSGTIRTDGRGESEPLAVDDPGQYSAEERHRLNRRVELRRH